MATDQVTILVDVIGADCGPFTITDNVIGTLASGVTRSNLLAGYIVNADETATTVTVTSTGVCSGTNLVIPIESVVCPPPPAPEYGYYWAHFYPCDGLCESTEDVVVAFDYGFTPNFTKFYREFSGTYNPYEVAEPPFGVYISDITAYDSCATACGITPPPATYEWYELTDCSNATIIYSQAYAPSSFGLNERVTNVAETNTYVVSSTYIVNPGGIQIAIVATGSDYCPTPPPTCTKDILINVTDAGYIKYYNCDTEETQYQYVSLGNVTLTNCLDCSTILTGIPFADLATFTITNCGVSCTTPPPPTPTPGGEYYYTIEAYSCFPCSFLGYGFARSNDLLITDNYYNNGDGNVYKITGYATGPGYDVELNFVASDPNCNLACSI
jgi:hypothetical protein